MNIELEPVEVKTLKATVYDSLLTAIATGKLPPGTQVTVAQLSKLIGVGSMPVREALQKLEAGKLVSISKTRRVTITELSSGALNELLKIRVMLECMAARESIQNYSDEFLEQLESIKMDIDLSQDPEEFLERNKDFHFTLYQNAKMPILLEMIEHLWQRVGPYLNIYAREAVDRSDLDYLRTPYHEGILQAIKERNKDALCKWLTLDLETAAERVVVWLDTKTNGDKATHSDRE